MAYNEGRKYTEEVHKIIKLWDENRFNGYCVDNMRTFDTECAELFGYYVKQSSDDMANASWRIYLKNPNNAEGRASEIAFFQDYPFQVTYIDDEEHLKEFMGRLNGTRSTPNKLQRFFQKEPKITKEFIQPHPEDVSEQVEGKVLDVALDLRPDSITYGEYHSVILDSEKQNMLYIPEGFCSWICSLRRFCVCLQVYELLQPRPSRRYNLE